MCALPSYRPASPLLQKRPCTPFPIVPDPRPSVNAIAWVGHIPAPLRVADCRLRIEVDASDGVPHLLAQTRWCGFRLATRTMPDVHPRSYCGGRGPRTTPFVMMCRTATTALVYSPFSLFGMGDSPFSVHTVPTRDSDGAIAHANPSPLLRRPKRVSVRRPDHGFFSQNEAKNTTWRPRKR